MSSVVFAVRAPPLIADGCAIGEMEGAGVRGQETSRGIKAGRRTDPRRWVGVPAPEEKQDLRGDHNDGVGAAQGVRPAGGESRVSADLGQETSRQAKAGPPTRRAARG